MRHMPRNTEAPWALMLAMKNLKLLRTMLEGGLSWKGPQDVDGAVEHAASQGACDALAILRQAVPLPMPRCGKTNKHCSMPRSLSRQGLRCAPILMEAGAHAEVSTREGWTRLDHAVGQGDSPEAERAIRALEENGARVDYETPEKQPLRQAARHASRMVALLLSVGAC
ncbi:hypothetical protein [Corallococcus sp. AB011P]|uniref:hypothetical protein n=1 Tax=Corallococcus sp. AB011P TaxID=2316735 RepID=UPI0011C3D9F3|nr:hypothetical protein [Corallococcus sp. AB011P]